MKKWIGVLFALALLSPVVADPDVSTTTGTAVLAYRDWDNLEMVAVGWETPTTGTGAVTASITGLYGVLNRIVIVPDDEPTSAPTNLYDVSLTDVDGVDLLDGMGANLSSVTLTTIGTTWTYPMVFGNLNLGITNAGNSRGLVRVYYNLP